MSDTSDTQRQKKEQDSRLSRETEEKQGNFFSALKSYISRKNTKRENKDEEGIKQDSPKEAKKVKVPKKVGLALLLSRHKKLEKKGVIGGDEGKEEYEESEDSEDDGEDAEAKEDEEGEREVNEEDKDEGEESKEDKESKEEDEDEKESEDSEERDEDKGDQENKEDKVSKEPALSIEATKKVNEEKEETKEKKKTSSIKEREEARNRNAEAMEHIGVFSRDAERAMQDSPEFSEADFDLGEIEIPESLLADAEDLEILAQSLSSEDIEDAAKFLGVFEGGGKNVKKLDAYAGSRSSEEGAKKKGLSLPSVNLNQLRKLLEKFAVMTKLPIFDSERQQELEELLELNKQMKAAGVTPEMMKQGVQTPVSPTGDSTQTAVSNEDGTPAPAASAPAGAEQSAPGDPTSSEDLMDLKERALQQEKERLALEEDEEEKPKRGLFGLGRRKQKDDLGLSVKEVQLRGKGLPGEQQEQSVLAAGAAETSFTDTKEKKKKGFFGKKKPEAKLTKGNLGIDLQSLQHTEEETKKKGFFGRKNAETNLTKDNLGINLSSLTPEQPGIGVAAENNEAEKAKVAKLTPEELKAYQEERKKQLEEQKEKMAKDATREKEEEKRWKEEAERREKVLKERKEKRQKEAEKVTDKAAMMKIRMPEKKKQNAFQRFMTGLNYMGMEKERTAFINNLGTMMSAGLPLIDGLNSLKNETRNKQMKKVVGRVIVAVELGSPLWRAMDGQYFFRPQQVAMVRVGEEAGNLVENLQYLAIQEEKDRSLKGKVKTAMIYPIIVFSMLSIIVMGLGMFVLPNLIQVIFSLGVPLPFVTRMIVKFTNFFSEQGVVAIPSFFGGMFLVAMLTKYTSFKVVVQWIFYKIPGIGVLMKEATLSRFGVVMGGLLRAGVPVTEALESLVNVTTLVRYKKFYALLLEHIKLGDSFGTSFKKIKMTGKCFPPSMQQLIVTGEKSGSLTKIMVKSAEIHEKKASDVAEKLPVILEPMLLLFIGGLVGTIALGVLAPIYSVVGNVGG